MNLEQLANIIRENSDGMLTNVSTTVIVMMAIVVALLAIVSVIAFFVSIYLAISYARFNRKKNSRGMSGEQIARRTLDYHGIHDIRVSATGSIIFGNSYSHYFKKIRLRRLTWKKSSVTSMAMAEQKAQLAVMDREGDADMRTRVRLTPIIYLGPLAMVPLVIIGALLDYFILKTDGQCTLVLTVIGLALYALSFIMSLLVIKTEKKAQRRAIKFMQSQGVPPQEIAMCEQLYRLYNIEYVNDMVIALLELIYRVLQIVANAQSNSKN